MAKKAPNQKPRPQESPFDRRRSRRFDTSAPMPLLLQKILREELARLISCKQGDSETKLPAQDLLCMNLVARAMNGDAELFDLVLGYLPIDSDEVRCTKTRKRTAR